MGFRVWVRVRVKVKVRVRVKVRRTSISPVVTRFRSPPLTPRTAALPRMVSLHRDNPKSWYEKPEKTGMRSQKRPVLEPEKTGVRTGIRTRKDRY